MPRLKTLNLDDFDACADAWDELWSRSDSRLPTATSDFMRLWCDCFSDGAPLTVLVVTEGNQMLAGLPLVAARRGPFQVYGLPSNCTVSAGDLLLDPQANCDAAIALLAEGLNRLPGCLVAFDGIKIESDRWQRLIDQFHFRGQPIDVGQGNDVGLIDVLHDWDAYTRTWSRNHRKAMRRSLKKLQAAGEVVVERVQQPSDDELEKILQTCFEIEDRGWKGEAGTSILKTPQLREYYLREAKMMRDRGMLDLWLLRLDGRIVAFDYSYLAKGVVFSCKIGFDPAFDHLSPGRSLLYYTLERYHQDPGCNQVDTLGVICDEKAKWITSTYKSSRLWVPVGGPMSNSAMRAWKVANRIRKRLRPAEAHEFKIRPGVQEYLQAADTKPEASSAGVSPIVAPVPTAQPQSPSCVR